MSVKSLQNVNWYPRFCSSYRHCHHIHCHHIHCYIVIVIIYCCRPKSWDRSLWAALPIGLHQSILTIIRNLVVIKIQIICHRPYYHPNHDISFRSTSSGDDSQSFIRYPCVQYLVRLLINWFWAFNDHLVEELDHLILSDCVVNHTTIVVKIWCKYGWGKNLWNSYSSTDDF